MFDISQYSKQIWTHLVRLNKSSPIGILRYSRRLDYINRFLPHNAVILEAGAHKGTDTVRMAKRWPDSTIHAFEPVPKLFNTLTERTRRQLNVHRYQLALSNKNGFFEFHLSAGTSDGSGSLLVPKKHLTYHPTVLFSETISVKTVTLDSWAQENDIKNIDFMWLDLQGSEFFVLEASQLILPTIKILYTEINTEENYEGTKLYPEYKKWLISINLVPWQENIYWKDYGNSIFIRKDVLK